jgi:hypothetical protein
MSTYIEKFKKQNSSAEVPTQFAPSTGMWRSKAPTTLNKNDFPPLTLNTPLPVLAPGELSLAERLKQSIQREEEEAKIRRYRKSSVNETVIAFPMSSFVDKRAQAEKDKLAAKKAALEAEEDDYRWQIDVEGGHTPTYSGVDAEFDETSS